MSLIVPLKSHIIDVSIRLKYVHPGVRCRASTWLRNTSQSLAGLGLCPAYMDRDCAMKNDRWQEAACAWNSSQPSYHACLIIFSFVFDVYKWKYGGNRQRVRVRKRYRWY